MTQDAAQVFIENQNLHQQETEFSLIEALLPYVQKKTFIDIGAEKGTFTHSLSAHGFSGCFFEPLPKFIPELRALAEKTNTTFFPYAVDQTDRTTDFYLACDLEGNPLEHFSSLHPLEQDGRIKHQKIANVTCRSLDSLRQENLIDQHFGIIKIDTEGNDLNVLKGMHSVTADVLMREYFMPGTYKGWELGHPAGLINEAKNLGFDFFLAIKRIDDYEFISVNNPQFLNNQWGNLIFLKNHVVEQARDTITELVARSEILLFEKLIETTGSLRKRCDERMQVINVLDEACSRLKDAVYNTSIAAFLRLKLSQKWLAIKNRIP